MWREVRRCADAGVTGEDWLTIALAVWLFAFDVANEVPNTTLTRNLGAHLLKAVPTESKPGRPRSAEGREKVYPRSRQVRRNVNDRLGSMVRQGLAVLLHRIVDHRKEELEKVEEIGRAAWVPFAGEMGE